MKFSPSFYIGLLLANATVFADSTGAIQQKTSFNPGDLPPKGQFSEAYNPSADIQIKRTDGSWRPDTSVQLSFLYYFASEDGLDYAESADLVSAGVVSPSNSRLLKQSFDYQPAFKVGLGTKAWDWDLNAEYTWIRQTNHVHKTAPVPSPNLGTGIWFIDSWFVLSNRSTGQSLAATEVRSKWNLSMDLADLSLSHSYYFARRLTIAPLFGMRGAWIRQKVNVTLDLPPQGVANQLNEVYSHNSSNSWAVGPRAGLQANLLLGKGFRVQGDVYGSLLFTEYTTIKHSEKVSHPNDPSVIKIKEKDYECIRPIAEMGLGVGWGSYFNKDRFHFDFSANYDFNIFWSQNMIRKLVDETFTSVSASPGDLFLHGLNLTASFDF
jgi:hypothetical protein